MHFLRHEENPSSGLFDIHFDINTAAIERNSEKYREIEATARAPVERQQQKVDCHHRLGRFYWAL